MGRQCRGKVGFQDQVLGRTRKMARWPCEWIEISCLTLTKMWPLNSENAYLNLSSYFFQRQIFGPCKIKFSPLSLYKEVNWDLHFIYFFSVFILVSVQMDTCIIYWERDSTGFLEYFRLMVAIFDSRKYTLCQEGRYNFMQC